MYVPHGTEVTDIHGLRWKCIDGKWYVMIPQRQVGGVTVPGRSLLDGPVTVVAETAR